MNKRRRKTLDRILSKPTRADITWDEARTLFDAIGAEIFEGKGSRVLVVLETRILRFHKPHPQKELKKYAVELIRDFLMNAGVVE